jgi:hypothetical protein
VKMITWRSSAVLILIIIIACEGTPSDEPSAQSAQSSSRSDLVIISRADELNLVPNDFDLDWTFEPGTGADEAKIRSYEVDAGLFSATLPNIITSTVQVHLDTETAARTYASELATLSERSASKSKNIGDEAYFWINGPVYEVTFRFKNVIGVVQSLATFPYEGSEGNATKWAEILADRIAERGQLGPASTPTALVITTVAPTLVAEEREIASPTTIVEQNLVDSPATVKPLASSTPRPTPAAVAVPTPLALPLTDPLPTPISALLPDSSPTPNGGELVIPTPRAGPTITPAPPDIEITSAYTGFYLDSIGETVVRRTNRRNSIELRFTADIDPATVQITDFELFIDGIWQHPLIAVVGGPGFSDRVFLTLFADLMSSDAPEISIVSSISSLDRRIVTTETVAVLDTLSPIISVALSNGSSESNPSGLTNDKITLLITSDEALSSGPTVEIFDENNSTVPERVIAVPAPGNRIWGVVIEGDVLDGSTTDGRLKYVRVTANDAAHTTDADLLLNGFTRIPFEAVIGQTVIGGSDASDGNISYVLDKTKPTLSVTPSGPISDVNPQVQWDFGEVVSITEILFGLRADLQDFTDRSSTFDGKTYFSYMAGLGLGTYFTIASAVDLAGNEAFELQSSFDLVDLTASPFSASTLEEIIDLSVGNYYLVAQDGIGLGDVMTDPFSDTSICNPLGVYGDFGVNSIRNESSVYGSVFSTLSPYNRFSFSPPYLIGPVSDEPIAVVTSNTVTGEQLPTIHPDDLLEYLGCPK